MAPPTAKLSQTDVSVRQRIKDVLIKSGVGFGERLSDDDPSLSKPTIRRLLSRYTQTHLHESLYLVETVTVNRFEESPALFEFYFVNMVSHHVDELNLFADDLFSHNLQVVSFRSRCETATFKIADRYQLPASLMKVLQLGRIGSLKQVLIALAETEPELKKQGKLRSHSVELEEIQQQAVQRLDVISPRSATN